MLMFNDVGDLHFNVNYFSHKTFPCTIEWPIRKAAVENSLLIGPSVKLVE